MVDSNSVDERGAVTDQRPRRLPRRRSPRATSGLVERWTTVDDVKVFYRESPKPPDAAVMMHLHGFGLSGRYLLPTAERLGGEFHTLVPDLPGFGRSGRSLTPLDVPDLAHAAVRFLDDRGIESVTLVGNSMGCPSSVSSRTPIPSVSSGPSSSHRPVAFTTSRSLARSGSWLGDGFREPTRLMRVAVPDYLRFGVPSTMKMFRALTQYPSLERLLGLRVPTLVVIGDRDPLDAEPGADSGGRRADRELGAAGGAGGSGSRHQLQPPRRAGQRDPPVHGRHADRRRPQFS